MFRDSIFKLLVMAALAAYIGFESLFTHTCHQIVGDRHVFAYGWTGILLSLGFNIVPIGASWFLWRVRKDRIGAVIFLLFVPAYAAFVLPQTFMERVELTSTQLRHRREPPHTRFNADIAWDDIASATELQYIERGLRGYIVQLKNGRTLELPANTVMTAARDTIDVCLRSHSIPVKARVVRRDEER